MSRVYEMQSIKRALIVVDVQNEYVTGHLRIEYPPLEQSLINIETILVAAIKQGIAVIAFQHTAPKESPIFGEGSASWQLLPLVANQQPDKIFHKSKASCFARTELDEYLKKQSIDTVTIIGYMTHNCDISTAIEAEEKGYNVEFIADASGSLPYMNEAGAVTAEELHRAFSVVLHSSFGAVVTTEQWLKLLTDNKAAVRSNIYASHQQASLLL